MNLSCILPIVVSWAWAFPVTDKEALEYTSAVLWTESAGDPAAISSAGALGLMQMTPIALQDLRERGSLVAPFCVPGASVNLLEPTQNVIYGSCFLALMRMQYASWTETLIAYNAGPSRVEHWRRTGRMPLETVNYIRKVEAYRNSWCGSDS